MKARLGPEIVRSYKRLSYTVWHALAEFIDNSLQSYRANKPRLDLAYAKSQESLTVQITYRRSDGGRLIIHDNAMGMTKTELTNALRIGKPPNDTSGLSEFGLGMKTAACWFGERWTLRTKRLNTKTGRQITFVVEDVADNRLDLQEEEFTGPADEHFTEIEITELHNELRGRQINTLKNYLQSMYRKPILSNELVLIFNEERLTWRSPAEGNIHLENGRGSCQDFEFEIDDQSVFGWLAVLESGSRARAGLTIIRRGRVIKGWPSSWRPQSIFGQLEGSNDLVNQRLIGEINMDDFGVSHTKDEILWKPNQQDRVENELAEIAKPLIDIATSYRKRGAVGTRPSQATINFAAGMLDEEIRSQRFRSVINANGSTPKETYVAFSDSTTQSATTVDPLVHEVDGLRLNIFLADDLSDRDPYLGIVALAPDVVTVVINMNHPHINDLNGRMGVLNHLKACTYEGVAQWKVKKAWDEENPALIRAIKDSLLRVGRTVSDVPQTQ